MALGATLGLTISKIGVSLATGSVGVLSEAIHSGLDLLSSLVTFFVVRESAEPADHEHQFGHAKIESLSAMFEAFLLMLAGAYILYEAFVVGRDTDHQIHNVGWGLLVTGASVVINLYVYFQNRGVAHAEESIAIETNAYHFLTDVFSSLAVFVSLAVIHFTKLYFIDAIVASIIAVYVFWVGVEQIKKCIAELADTALPADEIAIVEDIIRGFKRKFINFHDLKTRKAGPVRYIEFHLSVCSEMRVSEAHAVCDEIEESILRRFEQAQTNIHVEPCGNHEPGCNHVCRIMPRDHS